MQTARKATGGVSFFLIFLIAASLICLSSLFDVMPSFGSSDFGGSSPSHIVYLWRIIPDPSAFSDIEHSFRDVTEITGYSIDSYGNASSIGTGYYRFPGF